MAPPSIQPVSAATVRILDARGGRAGQGLAVSLPGARTLILTCHHVVLQSGDAQQVAIELFDELDAPRGRTLARLDEARSDPRHDLAVLIPLAELAVAPVRLARLASRYGGPLRVEGVTREPEDSQRFNATLAAPTRLDLQDPLFTGSIPVAFRLTEVSDVKRGVSGSPVAAAGAVVGLTHFSRGETADSARESYVVPITAWFARNPELAAISRPFVDPALSQVAIVKIGADLDPAGDFELPPYPYETILERAELRDAEKALQSHRRCLILGRPGSGKTWMAWQLARKSAGVVVMPRANRPPEQFDTSALLESGLTLLIDAAELLDSGFAFEDWYRRLANPDGLPPSLLVTSRDDRDWQGVRQRFPRLAAVLDPRNSRQTVYASATPAGGSDIDLERAREFAEQIGLNAAQFQHFDGTIGSLIAPTGDMAARYESLREERFGEATGSLLLDALKTLRLLHLELTEAMARRIAAIALGQEPSESLWRELKRLTAQAGFGRFDEQGFFRGYKVYLEQSVTYVPSMDDFHRFAAVLPEGPDDTPLVSAGIKLLQYGDDRGMEFLGAAIAKGSKPAILTAVLTMSEVRSYLPAAIRVAHELVRREPADYYGLLGALYRRWGKRKWAIRAYRAAMDAGDEEAGSPLGALLLEDEGTREEGKTYLRQAIRDDASGMDAVALAGHLIDEIGAEVEAEKLLRQGNAAASPMARILLGSLYSAWPGHWQQAKELLEPIATDTSSAFARPLALMACEILRQAAGARGEDAEVRRWSSESGRIGAITQNAYEIFRSTSAPTTFREGHRESRRGPHTGASIAVSESRMVLAVPSMKRRGTKARPRPDARSMARHPLASRYPRNAARAAPMPSVRRRIACPDGSTRLRSVAVYERVPPGVGIGLASGSRYLRMNASCSEILVRRNVYFVISPDPLPHQNIDRGIRPRSSISPGPEIPWTVHWEHLLWKMF